MVHERTPPEQVAHLVRLFHRGIICPSEMWRQIADTLRPDNVTDILDSLPDETKEQLLVAWIDRPPAAYIAQPGTYSEAAEYQAVCVPIVRWCEERIPNSQPPAEPDGWIRVRIEGDVVRRVPDATSP